MKKTCSEQTNTLMQILKKKKTHAGPLAWYLFSFRRRICSLYVYKPSLTR